MFRNIREPLLHFPNFELYHLFAIPLLSSTTLIPLETILAASLETYHYMGEPSRKLSDQYFCQSRIRNWSNITVTNKQEPFLQPFKEIT